jgi:hypothetical protein
MNGTVVVPGLTIAVLLGSGDNELIIGTVGSKDVFAVNH